MVNVWKLKKSLNYLAKQKRKYRGTRPDLVRKIEREQEDIKNKIVKLRKIKKKDGIT